MQILRNAGKCKQTSENASTLVQVRDVMNYMPQLKYMLRNEGCGAPSEEVPPKRPRLS